MDGPTDGWGVDRKRGGSERATVMDLVMLAQLSVVGYEEANSIISKLIKKMSDGERLNNPSAFVHECVNKARKKLLPDRRH